MKLEEKGRHGIDSERGVPVPVIILHIGVVLYS